MASARVRVFNLSLHLRNGGKAVSGRGGTAGKWREGTCPDVFGGADVGYVRILSYLCRKYAVPQHNPRTGSVGEPLSVRIAFAAAGGYVSDGIFLRV